MTWDKKGDGILEHFCSEAIWFCAADAEISGNFWRSAAKRLAGKIV